ncbi:DUF2231 domain-containing protein [Sulfobacillus thermosulfidooxidans]|uniref:DUF2231 domain-containing protein n=1 Tax=Sulfobacillus thermosulfidooxidans TaxID=28034 RepID=UPI0006B55DB2|nr:DUF2231 domain-containing protein [Sulfobacillus thermosulfidooxidans]
MHFIAGLWNAFLGTWIRIGIHLFPHTIHPMVVHFPIALLYLALAIDILGKFVKTPDRFFDRASFWLTILGFIAGAIAAAMGVISEQFVRWNATTSVLLSAHQRDAVLTGIFALLAIMVRLFSRYPAPTMGRNQAWSFWNTGRGRSNGLSTLFLLLAVIMITWTGSLGGTMVYHYGVGIRHVTYKNPLKP